MVESDIHSYEETTEGIRVHVGSGSYHFKYPNPLGLTLTFTENSRLIDILDHQESADILKKHAPWITRPPGIFEMKAQRLSELVDVPEAELTRELIHVILEELNQKEKEPA
ncbi:hypothetical protein [Paenibacillus sp. DCT19]|uniref:hypothetical protein n=1 Tax=Paenibacillus sp. DCT19 TaxID=2211212 RepID=UPI000FE253C9|nr:hypothetical protein [Paenibacillus sp. DCT19]